MKKEQLLDLLHSRESIAYKAGLEEVREKIKEIINKKEQVHGFQPYTTGNEEFERKVFFDGFDDGRAMMKIDLLNLIKSIEQAEQLITHKCCDGECNHDDCCSKVEANCPLKQ